MGIKKQEFYEGAALHALACNGGISIRFEAPFFVLDNRVHVHLKYSTRNRSPWGFTFMPYEQELLREKSTETKLILGLICGADGIAAFEYSDYLSVAAPRKSALRISCFRQHGQHYEVSGPDGVLCGKVAPSNWKKILKDRG